MTKMISRPSTVQRDELFRRATHALMHVNIATLPEQDGARTYYADSTQSTAMLAATLDHVGSAEKLREHVTNYTRFTHTTNQLIHDINEHPDNFAHIFARYLQFVDELSIFLNVTVAVDTLLEPTFREQLMTAYPESADTVLRIIEKPLNQALLIKEYTWLRTNRIDRLKSVQVVLRSTYDALTQKLRTEDNADWCRAYVVSLLNCEIDDYVKHGIKPSLFAAKSRATQPFLYYYSADGVSRIITDPETIEAARLAIQHTVAQDQRSLISPGTVAYKGVASGRVVLIHNIRDLAKVTPGTVMVARITMPSYTVAMRRANGIITAEDGITSHAAIIARELKKPCIVSSENCMDILKDGSFIVLDTVNQIVRQQTNF